MPKPLMRKRSANFSVSLPVLRPSAIPLTVVYGPPASGKTTHVNKNAHPDDLIIDMDLIKQGLSGLSWYQAGEEWVGPALERRNELLTSLSRRPPTHRAAWFIVTAAWASHRRHWDRVLRPHSTVMLDVPADVCIARVLADQRRAHRVDHHINLIREWWDRYTQDVQIYTHHDGGSAPMPKPLYRGTYSRRSRAVREAASRDPRTRCRRCGRTYAEAVRLWGPKAAAWQAGHVVDGHPGSPLAAEHAKCNMAAGARLVNAKRSHVPVSPNA